MACGMMSRPQCGSAAGERESSGYSSAERPARTAPLRSVGSFLLNMNIQRVQEHGTQTEEQVSGLNICLIN